jgi:hypothetical protein
MTTAPIERMTELGSAFACIDDNSRRLLSKDERESLGGKLRTAACQGRVYDPHTNVPQILTWLSLL